MDLLASAAALPTSRATRIAPQPLRVFCRRLHLPLPLSHRTLWPPTRRVLPRGRGVGEESVPSRVRRSASLQEGRRSSPRTCSCWQQRAGPAQAVGSDIVARSPAGHRHDDLLLGGTGRPGQELQTTTVPEATLEREDGRARVVVQDSFFGAGQNRRGDCDGLPSWHAVQPWRSLHHYWTSSLGVAWMVMCLGPIRL